MIKALIKKDTPKEELIEYLDQLTMEENKDQKDKNRNSQFKFPPQIFMIAAGLLSWRTDNGLRRIKCHGR